MSCSGSLTDADDLFFREVASNCWDAEERIEEYGKAGVQVRGQHHPGDVLLLGEGAGCRRLGEVLERPFGPIVRDHPKHYVGLASVPMQDTDLAVEVLRAYAAGLQGSIKSNVNGLNLVYPRFAPFYEACEELGTSLSSTLGT